MRKSISVFLVLILVSTSLLAQQNDMNYSKEWARVFDFENRSLPKSAAEEVNRILQKAVSEKNTPQVVKSLIHQGKYELAIDNQNDTLLFHNLKEMIGKSNNPTERSVLHSMLGELYIQYYQSNEWTINQRTEINGYIPEDIKEWTKNIFFDSAVLHLNASLEAKDVLEKVDVESFAEVINLGKDSRRFFPTMYDFLSRRAIEVFSQINSNEDLTKSLSRKGISTESLFKPVNEYIALPFEPENHEYSLWALETYRKLLSSLLERKMEYSIVITELEKLRYLQRLNNAYQTYALHYLNLLYEKWKGNDFSVEIIDRIAETKLKNTYNLENSDKDVIYKELYFLLQATIKKYPNYERLSILENRLINLTHPEFSVSGNNSFAIKGEKKLTINYKNLKSVKIKLFKLNSPLDIRMANTGSNNSIFDNRTFIKDFDFTLPVKPEYTPADTIVPIVIDQPGSYMLEFSADVDFSSRNSEYYLAVTDLAAFSRSSDKNTYEFFVVDRSTGKPVPNAKIEIYKLPGTWRNSMLTHVETIPVNKQGVAKYNKEIPNNDVFYHAIAGNDKGSLISNLPGVFYEYSDNNSNNQDNESITIFTDRSLYRPGQTVFFKAIVLKNTDDQNLLVSDKSIEIKLFDANNQEISTQTLTTNDFGSIAGEFILPQGLLTGGFSLRTDNGSVYFNVEEYKRPTFEISFEKIEQTYKFNEEVVIKGKAESYSGVKLQNASVSYRISRQQIWWRYWGGRDEHFAEGFTTTDNNGTFEIRFTPEKTDTSNSGRMAYSFVVEASITDVNGETQNATYNVNVGDVSMLLEVEFPNESVMEKSSIKGVRISAKNLDGNNIDANGTFQVFSLNDADTINKQVFNGSFITGDQPELDKRIASLPSGKYKIKLESVDSNNNKVNAESDFVVYSYSDSKPPYKTNNWLVIKKNSFSKDLPAEVIFGASDKVNLLYEVWQDSSLLERKWIILNNENNLFKFSYKPEYKNGVSVMFTYVKDEIFYTNKVDLNLEREVKGIDIKLSIFRDKIMPGSAEQWMVTVKDKKGNPANSEIIASMYDFSLEQILPTTDWDLYLSQVPLYRNPSVLQQDISFGTNRSFGNFNISYKMMNAFYFDRFNWFDFSFNSIILSRAVIGFGVAKNASAVRGSEQMDMLAESEVITTGYATQSKSESAVLPPPSDTQEPQEPQIRRNFNETAFFYPQLRTNSEGETQIDFTVPESNTKWRFRILAHDKELNIGKTEAFTISQKELMVTPNLPRFFRHGDKTSINTKISNLSDSTLKGNVELVFFNPVDDKIIDDIKLDNNSQTFSLEMGASSNVSWAFIVPENIDLIGVRIVAQNKLFSDGEQHALPVLSNRLLVTENMRMDIQGNETKSFKMEKIANISSKTSENYRLTLEFTSNAAWYAIQSLPVLSNPDNDNSVSWFASFYANSLGYYISQKYPRVSAMVDAWRKHGGSKETFLSNLEKNQELKNVLLEETPWILESKNESEQKEKLSLLFDINRSKMQTSVALEKLRELQNASGGWSWFKDFRPNVSITHYILYGFTQLSDMGIENPEYEIKSMKVKAVSFTDSEALNRFEQLKKWNNKWREIKKISIADLEYLFVRSSYKDYPQSSETKGMTDFYLDVVEENWTQYSLYERALISMLMSRNNNKNVEKAIISSFREHATVNDEMGMFWANNNSNVFMSQSAVSVHTFIMDAFITAGANANEMENMKRWLLKQKQTQRWGSTHATLDAVHVLLSTGKDWFASDGQSVVTIGAEKLENGNNELGTGYLKNSWIRSEIKPEMANVNVQHKGNAPAWGALYFQYFEDADKVIKTDASLDVEKLLFIERTDDSGRFLIPVSNDSQISIGDKVTVRLIIRTDRDYDFVHIKDMRAAALEPVDQVSATSWQNGVIYYKTSKDASTNFYFDHLPRGTFVFEYEVYATRSGEYSNGLTTIQCMYAPEFTSHTSGMRIKVSE